MRDPAHKFRDGEKSLKIPEKMDDIVEWRD